MDPPDIVWGKNLVKIGSSIHRHSPYELFELRLSFKSKPEFGVEIVSNQPVFRGLCILLQRLSGELM
jgi:hypothetical protein